MNVRVVKEIIKTQPKTCIMIFALALLNVCLWAYAAAYQKPRLEELQRIWFEKRKSVAGGAALSIASAYQQGESDLEAWRSRIIPKKEFARFAGNLFEIAANNSLAFKGVTYKVIQHKDENLVSYVLDFNVTGKYAAVKSFIADIGRMREIATLDNISLNNNSVTVDAVALKVQLTVYLRMEEQ